MTCHRLGIAPRRSLLLLALLCVCLLISLPFNRRENLQDILNNTQRWSESESHWNSRIRPLSISHLKALRNSTLGFQKVFVANLPERTDKLDAFRVSASLTGFDFEIIEGVNGDLMSPKALPGKFKDTPGVNKTLGCWRAHMNFAHTIVQNHLSTALMFEDDGDWDVQFRSQLERYALGSQYILNSTDRAPSHSPYGDGWDLMYLGHCSSTPVEGDDRRFIIENDPTAPPGKGRINFGKVPDMSPYDNTTRIIFAAKGGVCLYSYALSYRGAQKILYYLSMSINSKPVDLGVEDMCRQKERNFTCISVFPQIVDSHRSAGPESKDSDIAHRKEAYRERGYTANIVHSTRLNIDHLINGDMDKIENQYGKSMDPVKGPIKLSWMT